jgi:hypothetical protein
MDLAKKKKDQEGLLDKKKQKHWLEISSQCLFQGSACISYITCTHAMHDSLIKLLRIHGYFRGSQSERILLAIVF